jgi:hypothetical protein
MSPSKPESGPDYVPALDLNDLLFDHPSAGFVFQLESEIAIVDRAASPGDGALVLIETSNGFSVDLYQGQAIFGVITHLIKRLN